MMADKAEYAKKGIAKGRSIVAMAFADGVLLVADNPSASLHKISEMYDRIAFSGAGKYNEFEMLRKAGIRHADLKGYTYSREDVTARWLAPTISLREALRLSIEALDTVTSQKLGAEGLEVAVLDRTRTGRTFRR